MKLHAKKVVLGLAIIVVGIQIIIFLIDSSMEDGGNANVDGGKRYGKLFGGRDIKRKEIKPVCRIPLLDPYDKEAIKHIKNVSKLVCPKKQISYLENEMLVIKLDNVIAAYYDYVVRKENDDDQVEYKNRIWVTEKAQRVRPQKGAVGCLIDETGGMLTIHSAARLKKIVSKSLASVKNCNPESFWYLSTRGTIESYLERLCLTLETACFGQPICNFVLSSCGEQSDKFELKGDGSILHMNTMKYLTLAASNSGNDPASLALKEKSNAGKWILAESKSQNVYFRNRVQDDFVRVTIVKGRKVYEEYHATIVEKESVKERANSANKRVNLSYNVAMIMIDSQSASNVKRKLPRTYNYLKKNENTFLFEGHTIVGDGTTAQLSTVLAGGFEWNFTESRRGFPGAKPVDNWPFIFQNFTQRGYATMYNEDEPVYGTFNYRLHGFKKAPTDHYTRPFWLASKSDYYLEGLCHGNEPIHIRSFDYLMNLHRKYKGVPKFSLTVLSAMFHDDLSKVKNLDDDLLEFINTMSDKEYFGETIFILFGDHGARFDGFRETLIGKLEERMPFLSITLPKNLLANDVHLRDSLEHNSKVLTSHFDLHATLQHMFTYPQAPKVATGQSLFTVIDESKRTCETAGVKEHWCPCLQFTKLNATDPEVIKMARAVVNFINYEIIGNVKEAKEQCMKLTLGKIKRAGRKMPNDAVQRFKQTGQTNECIECEIVTDKDPNLQQSSSHYELVISVLPSGGVFEASVAVAKNTISVHSSISRINKYGDQPKCIQEKHPSLRKYCYCAL